MPLATGSRLGPYEVTGALGAGGMGEVYRAKDSKLGREVALKILPESVARDPDRLARFKREAQLLAALNHPNIAAIYGVEDATDTHALVLELVDGPTLADRIAQGPLPADEATEVARQIADALRAAHERGIIHRDLKPANIKLRPDGTVKVLDFGLARAFGPDGSDSSPAGVLANSPTITSPVAMTGIGIILGTAAYMAPEQARGKALDKRADIWAFGCVLYEMLSGKRAFEDEDVSLTLSRILQQDPDYGALPANLSPHVLQAIRLCLKKDPRQRVHDIADVRLAIDGAFQSPTAAAMPAAIAAPVPMWRRVLIPAAATVGGALVALVAAVLLMRGAPPPASVGVVRFEYVLPSELRARNTGRIVLAVSRDGRRYAFNANGGVYMGSLDEPAGHFIPGTTESLTNPIFSPDGTQLAYFQAGEIKKIAVTGGAPVVLASATNLFGATWSGDTIVYGQPKGIFQVSTGGGTPELLLAAKEGEQVDAPQILPGGEWVLFTVTRAAASLTDNRWNSAEVVAESLRSKVRKVLVPGGSDARYVAPGYLVYARDDELFAVKFDLSSVTVQGAAVSMLRGLRRADGGPGLTGTANYVVTDLGALFHVAGEGRESGEKLAWVGRDGTTEPIATIPANAFVSPRLSADDRRVLVIARGNVSIYDIATGRESRVASPGTANNYAAWSADERMVAFTATSTKTTDDAAWVQPLDGSSKAIEVSALPGLVHVDSWGPGGVLAAHHHPVSGRTTRLLLFPTVASSGVAPQELLPPDGDGLDTVFSPDGRYFAYDSGQAGRSEIYIRPYPGPGAPTTVSVGGGTEPAWAKNGELFYRAGDYSMMVVKVDTASTLRVSPPTRLFYGSGFRPPGSRARYAVTSDGQRFLMAPGLAPATGDSTLVPREVIRVVLNWTEELRRRLP